MEDTLTIAERLLNDSRISPFGNGSPDAKSSRPTGEHSTDGQLINGQSAKERPLIGQSTCGQSTCGQSTCGQPTYGQKWWASLLLGFLFALISGPGAHSITARMTSVVSMDKFHFWTLLIHTLAFVVVVRIILW